MKILSRIHRLIFFIALVVMGLSAGAVKSYAYPSTPGCDDTGCHFDIRNNNDHGNGSLRTAIEEGCRKSGHHLVEFERYTSSQTIALESQLTMGSDCKGTFEFAGSGSKEITLDGSALPKSQEPTGKECSLYVGTGNHTIHHMTFAGAPFGVCVFGDNVTLTDNNFGVKRDGTIDGNAVGLFLGGNKTQLYYNVFAGNTADGLVIRGHESKVQANYFGVLANNQNQDKGNGGAGIRIIGSGSSNLIGGDFNSQANVIRYNKDGGVVLAGDSNSTRNKISHNKIALNTGLGIDILGDGVTFPTTSQNGPNKLLAMPANVQVVPLQVSNPTSFLFRGKAPTNVSGDLFIEIYVANSADFSDSAQQAKTGDKTLSYGEGETLLTSTKIVKDGEGKFGVMIAAPGLTQVNKYVSAILRDSQGNTSEFSAQLQLKDKPNPDFPTDTPICGDGKKTGSEECDDGNTTEGDGCSPTCKNEPVPPCGDGVLDSGEQCDDGNAVNGDGCNTACKLEHPELCGNGVLNPGEQCDDGGNINGDGCNSTCQLEHPELCGNGVLNPGEQCDDGANANGDGCNSTCQLEHPELCGNGVLNPGEQCDDGANTNGDGCNSTCQLEHPELCGNSTINPGEQCDDGNHTPGDGCGPTCQNETTTCGDGIVNGTEGCDDSNTTNGDGCSSTCTVEDGWVCTGSPSVCVKSCGNGTLNPGEQCDDGGIVNGDGCSSTCTTEPGWTCTGEPSVCVKTCGNHAVDAGEQCDDGNTANGDCCSATCQFEPAGSSCDDGSSTTSGDQCNGSGLCSGHPGPLNPPDDLDAEPTPGGTTGGGSSGTSVTVTFTDNSDGEDGFTVERADGPCESAEDSDFTTVGTLPPSPGVGGTVTFVDNTVQPGQTYCYRARAFDDNKVSEPSNEDTVTTPNPGITTPLNMGLEGGGCSMITGSTVNSLATLFFFMSAAPMALIRLRRRK